MTRYSWTKTFALLIRNRILRLSPNKFYLIAVRYLGSKREKEKRRGQVRESRSQGSAVVVAVFAALLVGHFAFRLSGWLVGWLPCLVWSWLKTKMLPSFWGQHAACGILVADALIMQH